MNDSNLQAVHQRYIDVSAAFRSAWTFHQFVQGLRKVFPDDGLPMYDADFQSVYGRLKEVSHHLNELGAGEAASQLGEVESDLEALEATLLESDRAISPARLRQFFQRVRNYDDEILSQLVKFYLFGHGPGAAWPIDRIDKADFLVTKLCEDYQEETDTYALRDAAELRELSAGLWSALGMVEPDSSEIASSVAELEDVRAAIRGVESIDTLSELGLVQRLRELKHSFGSTYFHPRVLTAIVESNLAAKNRVQEMYRREEERIVAEYQQVFDLEREAPLDGTMQTELDQFRKEVERFEKQLQGANIRLEEVSRLRRRVRDLVPRLQQGAAAVGPVFVPADLDAEGGGPSSGTHESPEYAFVGATYERIVAVLEGTNPSHDPKKVTLDPEVFGFGLEKREVIAYRRLVGQAPCQRHTETLILRAAALRVQLEDLAQEIKGILDDTAVTRDAPVFSSAREATRIADLVVHRFTHQIEQVLMDGDVAEAQALQLVKMRLMRTYSGLWLLIYRP